MPTSVDLKQHSTNATKQNKNKNKKYPRGKLASMLENMGSLPLPKTTRSQNAQRHTNDPVARGTKPKNRNVVT